MSLKLATESKREMTRVRPLSTYGQKLYESTVNRHLFKIREIKREIDGCIDDIKLLDLGSISRPNADTYEKLLKSCYEAYRTILLHTCNQCVPMKVLMKWQPNG